MLVSGTANQEVNLEGSGISEFRTEFRLCYPSTQMNHRFKPMHRLFRGVSVTLTDLKGKVITE